METRKTDRRVIRTRTELTSALVALMVERGYEEVTVQHILDRAGVGRSTFYAHFRDKESLLKASLDNLRIGLEHHWRASLAKTGHPMGDLAFALLFLKHVDDYRHMWRAVVGRDCAAIVDRHMRRLLADLARVDLAGKYGSATDLEVAVQFTVGALMSLLAWWLDYEIAFSAEELNQKFLNLALPGLAPRQ